MGEGRADNRWAELGHEPILARSDLPPYAVYEVALTVRQLLQEEFPNCRQLDLQCKRASVLLAELLGERGVRARVVAGNVSLGGPGLLAEHVWCGVVEPETGEEFLLDASLSQFENIFGQPVPEVVWGPYEETAERYGYAEADFIGRDYDPIEFDPRRLQAARKALRKLERPAA